MAWTDRARAFFRLTAKRRTVDAPKRSAVAAGPLVPPGGGYQQRVAVNSLAPEAAEKIIAAARIRSQALMEERRQEIEAGLEHLSPAMEEDRAKHGPWPV